MFVFGFLAATFMGAMKLYKLSQGMKSMLITDNPWFYIALTSMLLGTQLFLAGFIGELLVKATHGEKHYTIKATLNF